MNCLPLQDPGESGVMSDVVILWKCLILEQDCVLGSKETVSNESNNHLDRQFGVIKILEILQCRRVPE